MSGFFGKVMGGLEAMESQNDPNGPATSSGNASNLVSELVASHGGVSGLMSTLSQGGLGDKLQSWVGSGTNAPMLASEVEQVFPPDQLEALAEKHGVPAGMVSQLLAQFLPHAVDQATPAGAAPNADSDPDQDNC